MWLFVAAQTPFEQVFGSEQAFLSQPAPKAVSLLGTIIAFVCLLWSIANSFYSSNDEDWRPKVMAFIKAIVIVAFIAYSGALVKDIATAVNQVYESSGAGDGIPKALDDIRANNKAYQQYKASQPPNWADILGGLVYAINDFCFSLGSGLAMAIWAVVWIFRFLQDVFIVMLYIILPLAFGLAVTPWFSNIGTSVISSLVGVLLWPVGFLMVDTFVLKILQAALQALNAWGTPPPGGDSLYSVWWFVGAYNPIGFGLALLVIGIVILLMTVFGYYAAIKIITSLFGAAGGMIASGIGALGKAASTAAGLAAGAAALGAGAAAFGGGSALSAMGSLGTSEALSSSAAADGETASSALVNERANVLGGAQPVTSDNGEVDGIVAGVSDAVESQRSTNNGSSQPPLRSPSRAAPGSTDGTVDGVVDGIASAVGSARNARGRGLGSTRSSSPGSSAFRGSSSELRQGGLRAGDPKDFRSIGRLWRQRVFFAWFRV